jgi:hypothetical protein
MVNTLETSLNYSYQYYPDSVIPYKALILSTGVSGYSLNSSKPSPYILVNGIKALILKVFLGMIL